MNVVEADAGLAVVERVRFRRISPTLGFADVRLHAVNLHNLRIEQNPDGRLTIRAPEQQDKHGRRWPAYSLQPECQASIEAEIGVLWARS